MFKFVKDIKDIKKSQGIILANIAGMTKKCGEIPQENRSFEDLLSRISGNFVYIPDVIVQDAGALCAGPYYVFGFAIKKCIIDKDEYVEDPTMLVVPVKNVGMFKRAKDGISPEFKENIFLKFGRKVKVSEKDVRKTIYPNIVTQIEDLRSYI